MGKSVLSELELSLILEHENRTFLLEKPDGHGAISRTTEERLQFQNRAVQGGRWDREDLGRCVSPELQSAGQRTLLLSWEQDDQIGRKQRSAGSVLFAGTLFTGGCRYEPSPSVPALPCPGFTILGKQFTFSEPQYFHL